MGTVVSNGSSPTSFLLPMSALRRKEGCSTRTVAIGNSQATRSTQATVALAAEAMRGATKMSMAWMVAGAR